jgi:hypothetical protein
MTGRDFLSGIYNLSSGLIKKKGFGGSPKPSLFNNPISG